MSGMAPTQRQMAILEWLDTQDSLTITQLVDRFGVSAMTIHRDLDKLADQGCVRKVRGGVLPAIDPRGGPVPQDSCTVCGKRVPARSQWIGITADGQRWHACCSHCGLLQLQNSPQPQSALSADFLYGRMVNVYQAAYVLGSDVMLCCVPSILCFASPNDAERFRQGFGGEVMDYVTATKAMMMTHHIVPAADTREHH